MTELFVFMLIMLGGTASALLVYGAIRVIWFIAKTFFPKSNFVEVVNDVFGDPEKTHGIKLQEIKPWSVKNAK